MPVKKSANKAKPSVRKRTQKHPPLLPPPLPTVFTSKHFILQAEWDYWNTLDEMRSNNTALIIRMRTSWALWELARQVRPDPNLEPLKAKKDCFNPKNLGKRFAAYFPRNARAGRANPDAPLHYRNEREEFDNLRTFWFDPVLIINPWLMASEDERSYGLEITPHVPWIIHKPTTVAEARDLFGTLQQDFDLRETNTKTGSTNKRYAIVQLNDVDQLCLEDFDRLRDALCPGLNKSMTKDPSKKGNYREDGRIDPEALLKGLSKLRLVIAFGKEEAMKMALSAKGSFGKESKQKERMIKTQSDRTTYWHESWKKPCMRVLDLMEEFFLKHKSPPVWRAHFEYKYRPTRKPKSASA